MAITEANLIKIFSDTTSTISPAEAEELGIYYLPQIIVFGDKSYRDDTELTSKEFLEKLRASSELPKTAAPPPALYTPMYKKLSEENHTMIVLCPSSKISGTYRSAITAAQDFPDADIHVVDTQTIGPALGTLVRKALKWAAEGVSASEIVDRVTTLGKKLKVYFYVDTLEYLQKGGRIGPAKALVGGLLQVKPILLFQDGEITAFENQRTKKKALARIIELVDQECPKNPSSELAILEADAMDDAMELRSRFLEIVKISSIDIADLPPAIIVHAGPGVLAASFFTS